jgi:hypothetical protein
MAAELADFLADLCAADLAGWRLPWPPTPGKIMKLPAASSATRMSYPTGSVAGTAPRSMATRTCSVSGPCGATTRRT